MPFQPGNKLGQGRKDKPFRDALLMEIKGAGDDHKRLRTIADALLKKADTGDVQAIREIADRVDGKVPQALVGDDEHPSVGISIVENIIVAQISDEDCEGLSAPINTQPI